MVTRLIVAFLALIIPFQVNAATCVPLETIRHTVEAEGRLLEVIRSAPVAANFVRIAGFDIPKDSHPVGLFIVRGTVNVMTGLIEPGECGAYVVISPLAVFKRNMGKEL